jgi:GNAT superfamily N-acetyltransferase
MMNFDFTEPFHDLACVACRPGLLKDTQDMLEITRFIWEGHDYVPYAWSEWLADPEGFLAVAEYGGRVVGIYMLECFSPQEWYLAGLRVHPLMEGRGIASRLHSYILEIFERTGRQGVLRLATMNPKVQHLCDQTGFNQICEYTIFTASCLPEPVDTFIPLQLDEAEKALGLIGESPVLGWNGGMIGHIWRWSEPQMKYLLKTIQEGRAWLWQGGAGVLTIVEDDEEDEKYPTPQMIGCSADDLVPLLLDYRRLVARLGYPYAGWIVSLHPELQPYLAKAGFERAWEKAIGLYERR